MPHEPKKRKSKAAKNARRASKTLNATVLTVCKNCGEKTLSHMACRSCGFYAGKKTIDDKSTVKVTRA